MSASAIEGNSITATSTGSPNSAHESYTPLGGAVPLVNILLGEVSPGGSGSGLYGKLILVMLSVFIAGLMVGRTPEYLGKKIQAREMKLAVIYILAVPAAVLGFGGLGHRQPHRPGRPVGLRGPRADRDGLHVRLDHQQQRLGLRRHHHLHHAGTRSCWAWPC